MSIFTGGLEITHCELAIALQKQDVSVQEAAAQRI